MQLDNPYEAPKAAVADIVERRARKPAPASRLQRLLAALVDTLVYVPAAGVYTTGMILLEEEEASQEHPWALPLALLGGILFVTTLALQLVLLGSNGWTVGKRVLRIRIVRSDGARAGLGRIFWLRMALVNVIGAVPFVGFFFTLVDHLFIFREDRRCLHDLIADTKVVQA